MRPLNKTNLGFFFDLGGSLETWDWIGTLKREVAIYNLLAGKFKRIYFFTYGSRQDLKYGEELATNIKIITKPRYLPDLFWEVLMPFWYLGTIRRCEILKTNQNSGALAAVLGKLLIPKAKLVIRSGYIGSQFAHATRWPLLARIYFGIEQAISYRLCNLAFIPTKANYVKLLKKYPFLKKKLKILNNFIDTDLFRKKSQESRAGEPAGEKYDLIYVARLEAQQKNQLLLLEAAQGRDWKLLFIGQGPEKEDFLALAQKNQIDLKIIDRVPNEELGNYYNAARLFVSPSLFEGNPKAMLEAMSSELPVVALRAPGVKNIIDPGKTGILADRNAKDFREKIERVLADEVAQKELGKEARRFVIKKFALTRIFRREYKSYLALLKKG